MRPLFPLLKTMKSVTTTTKIGQAMINILDTPVENKVVDPRTINMLAEK